MHVVLYIIIGMLLYLNVRNQNISRDGKNTEPVLKGLLREIFELCVLWIDSSHTLVSPNEIFSIFAANSRRYSRILIHFSSIISQKVLTFRVPYPRKCSYSKVWYTKSEHFLFTIPWKLRTFPAYGIFMESDWLEILHKTVKKHRFKKNV